MCKAVQMTGGCAKKKLLHIHKLKIIYYILVMQKDKKANVMVRLDPVVHDALCRIAKKENRPLAAQARHVITKFIEGLPK